MSKDINESYQLPSPPYGLASDGVPYPLVEAAREKYRAAIPADTEAACRRALDAEVDGRERIDGNLIQLWRERAAAVF